MGVDGRMHQPIKDAGGKPIAFLFISHDCPVCNTYAPEIGRLIARFNGTVKFDLVYCDVKLTAGEARNHAKQFDLDGATLLLDPKCSIAAFCKATVTPQAVVFDERAKRVYSGRIDDRYLALGQQRSATTSHDLAKALDAVLAHQSPKAASGPAVGCYIVFPNPT